MAKLNKEAARQRRKRGLRKKIRGRADRPRLCIFRSLKHVYVQVIDDDANKVLATASTLEAEIRDAVTARQPAPEPEAAAPAESTELEATPAAEAAPDPEKKTKKKKKKDKGGAKAAKKGKAAKAAKAERPPRRRYRPGPASGKVLAAVVVGESIAQRCQAAGIETVVFDRSGFRYHGRVAALADAARSAGLKF